MAHRIVIPSLVCLDASQHNQNYIECSGSSSTIYIIMCTTEVAAIIIIMYIPTILKPL